MRKYVLFLYIFLSTFVAIAQNFQISDSAIVSLITCSPGQELYSKFGHTAIRVNDKKTGLDVVFNYGIFSFETENFYYKFIKGQTDYQLGVSNTAYFLPEYAERNSLVVEHVLNLTVAERQKLIQLLIRNYEPQNRTYRYNFIFDNCATRPRDKVISALHGFVRLEPTSDVRTFRQLIASYVGSDTWLKFGLDIIFGYEADKFATQNESMFLPEVLMAEFQSAQIFSKSGESRKLVSERKILVDKKTEKELNESILFKPITFSLILMIVGAFLSLWDAKRQRHYKVFDTVLLIVTGLAGVIIFYLMFFSIHPLVKWNLNILWLNPLNLIVAVILWIRPLRMTMFFYQIFNIGVLVLALFAFALSFQDFNMAFFPIIVVLLMRSTGWLVCCYEKTHLQIARFALHDFQIEN
jgi:hypothetical protein